MNFDVPDMDCYSHIWLAVLMQAVEDATVWVPDAIPLTENHYHQRTAINWFRASREDIGSFNWVCSTLNLDREELLEKVRERRAEALRAERESRRPTEQDSPIERSVGPLRRPGTPGEHAARGTRLRLRRQVNEPHLGN